MTTLFRPVPITSAEQADALPVGTVAQFEPGAALSLAAVKNDGRLPGWWLGDERVPVGEVPGYVALVPTEALEETRSGLDGLIVPGAPHNERRLCTLWELTTMSAESTEQEPRACDECPDTTDVHQYGTAHLCPSCHHDAVRSGWTPGGGS